MPVWRPTGIVSARLLLGIIGVAAAVAGISLLPLEGWFGALQSWLAHTGPAAVLVFGLVDAIATATILPAAPFSIFAGMMFGLAGIPLALVSATAGATAAFCISRFCFRRHVADFVAGRPLLQALDHAVAEQGWRVVCLVRMSPLVPFNVQNYMFGVTRVGIGCYILATVAGISLNTAFCGYLGSLGRTSLAAAGPAALALPGLGVLCTLVAVVLVNRTAQRVLSRAVEQTTAT